MITPELQYLLNQISQRLEQLEALENTAGTTPTIPTAAVAIKAVDYTLTAADYVVVFTATGKTATLPAATGSGQTYRIVYRPASGSLTIDGNGTDTIKGELTQTLYAREDLIITDTATGIWE